MPEAVRTCEAFAQRVKMRLLPMDEFVETRASGTLRKAGYCGANTTSHSQHDRNAYEFGYKFEALPERFVTWGEARSEPDCHPLTEAWWLIERYASVSLFPGDEVEGKYIVVEVGGVRREGVGIIVRKTSVTWLPKGYIVFAIIAQYDPKTHDFMDAVNPC